MILFVLDNAALLPACRDYARRHALSGSDYAVFLAQGDAAAEPAVLLPEFSTAEKTFIDQEATRLAREWPFLFKIASSSAYRQINLAELLVHGLDYYLIWILKQSLAMKKILDKVKPSKVVVGYGALIQGAFSKPFESYYARSARQMCVSQGIPCEELNPLPPAGEETEKSCLKRPAQDASRGLLKIILGFLNACQPKSAKPQVAMLASLRVGLPLLEQLASSFRWLYLTLESAPKTALQLFRRNIPVVEFKLRPAGARLSFQDAWQECRQDASHKAFFSVRGVSLFEMAEPRLRQLFHFELPVLAEWVDHFFDFLEQEKIKGLVLDEDVTIYHKTLVKVADQLGIPSLVIQHGKTGQMRGFSPLSATRFAAWGDVTKKQMMGWGVPAGRIAVTGFPALPQKSGEAPIGKRVAILTKLGLGPKRRILFYAPSKLQVAEHGTLRIKLTPQEDRQFFQAVLQAFRALPDCSLVIKVHPGGKVAYYHDLLKQSNEDQNPHIRVVDNFNLRDLLEVTDVLINFSSTVAIEAMALDIPIVNVNFFEKEEYIPFESPSPVYATTQEKELLPLIRKALEHPRELSAERERFLEAYCGPKDNHAVARIFNLIEEELAKSVRVTKIGALVQARMTSQRLPGKVLKRLGSKTVLENLLDRLLTVFCPEAIVLVTSEEASDDPVAALGGHCGIKVFRGSLENVLDRYYQAAKLYDIDPVVRITADNPLIEPAYLRDLIAEYRDSHADYVNAKIPDDFPRGTTAEIFSRAALEKSWQEGRSPEDLEHVTWYIKHHPEYFKLKDLKPRPEWGRAAIRLALDEPRDFELLSQIFQRLETKNGNLFGLNEIFSLHQQEPELFLINQQVVSKSN